MKIGPKNKIILVKRFFLKFKSENLKIKMDVKMSPRVVTKKYVADPKIEFSENRFYSCLDARVQSDSVGLNV